MSYSKRTNIRAARGAETTANATCESFFKLRSLISAVITCAISFSLVLAFMPITPAGSAFADPAQETPTPGIADENKVIVTFNTNGGSTVENQEVPYGEKATEPTAPTKAGNIFEGWLLNGAVYDFDAPVTDNITLTAKWAPASTSDPEEHKIKVTYKVEYGKWNDGDSQPKYQTLPLVGDASGELEPPAVGDAPTQNCKAGKWRTEDGELPNGELPKTITAADAPGDKITYIYSYAQKEQFTISFDSDGGSAVKPLSVYEGDPANEPTKPTKMGMRFVHWVTPDGAAYKFGAPVNGDITLKAVWIRATGQWKSNSLGKWYEYDDGNYIKNDWLDDNGKRYHFDERGYMQTGWHKVAAPQSKQVNWYFFESTGVMATGWKYLGSAWYYLNPDNAGAMYESGQYAIAGKKYYFNGSGAMVKGWVNSGTKQVPIWYYYDASGAMAKGWRNLGGVWYYLDTTTGVMYEDGRYPISGKTYSFNSSGAMMTGWINSGTKQTPVWRYFEPSGAMAQEWALIGSIWYYLDPESGVMATGAQDIGDKKYFFASNGAMVTGWRSIVSNGVTSWYYYNPSGAMVVDNWALVGGVWYYMGADGIMYRSGQYLIAGKTYRFNSSGAMITGWVNTGSANAPVWYFYGPSGAMLTDAWVGNYWLGADGIMVTDNWVDNGKYYVGHDGKWDSSKKPEASSDSE